MTSPEALVRGYPHNRYTAALSHFPSIKPSGKIDVLDVGGFKNNPVLAKVLTELSHPAFFNVTSINLPKEYHGRHGDIIYDGQHLPLNTESIPVVVAVDVLEHVERRKRTALILEMVRAAKVRVIISGPFHSPENATLEEELLEHMKQNGLPPKTSILQHRRLGLPTLAELVAMARTSELPFQIYPATDALRDFRGLHRQVDVLTEQPKMKLPGVRSIRYRKYQSEKLTRAKTMAENDDRQLRLRSKVNWPDAYRAVLVIEMKPIGRIINEQNELFRGDEKTAYQAALTSVGFGELENPILFYAENPIRGRHIVFEGPEGSGKTTIMRIVARLLADWGYTIAIPTDFGRRQNIRDLEKATGLLIREPQRGQYFTEAMVESTITGNAHSLTGPCSIALNDRGLTSVPMHRQLHCPNDETIQMLIDKHAPHNRPDLTIVLEVDDLNLNFEMMQREQDLANMKRTMDQLKYQREYYRNLPDNFLSGNQICHIKNPGINRSLTSVVREVLTIIKNYCGIPTSRDLSDDKLVGIIDEVLEEIRN